MFNVKKIIVSTLSKTDGLIRCATYNMAGNLCQQPGDRKRKSPRPQNRYRSEIWGKDTANNRNKTGTYQVRSYRFLAIF